MKVLLTATTALTFFTVSANAACPSNAVNASFAVWAENSLGKFQNVTAVHSMRSVDCLPGRRPAQSHRAPLLVAVSQCPPLASFYNICGVENSRPQLGANLLYRCEKSQPLG